MKAVGDDSGGRRNAHLKLLGVCFEARAGHMVFIVPQEAVGYFVAVEEQERCRKMLIGHSSDRVLVTIFLVEVDDEEFANVGAVQLVKLFAAMLFRAG